MAIIVSGTNDAISLFLDVVEFILLNGLLVYDEYTSRSITRKSLVSHKGLWSGRQKRVRVLHMTFLQTEVGSNSGSTV